MKVVLLIIRNNKTPEKLYLLMLYRREAVATALLPQFLTEEIFARSVSLWHYPIVR